MFYRAGIIMGAALTLAAATQAETKSYSKAVQQNCNQDYKTYCGEYGLESNALRDCMDRNGGKLAKACVNALVTDGHVGQAEVDRRRKLLGGKTPAGPPKAPVILSIELDPDEVELAFATEGLFDSLKGLKGPRGCDDN